MSRPRNRSLTWILTAAAAALLLLMSGCVAPPVMTTKLARFPLMYEEKPTTILVLPPINHTTAADAKDYYATTVAAPLALRGFYVLPMEVTSQILKSQGIYDTEMIRNQPVAKFKQYFGADAVLYTEITRWSTSYAVISASLTVAFHATLRSTLTERVLWEYSGTLMIDLTGRANSGNLIADLVAGAVATSIAAAAADYVPYAGQANTKILYTIPVGKYHEEHMADQGVQFVDQGALSASPQPAGAAPAQAAASSASPATATAPQAEPVAPIAPAPEPSAQAVITPAKFKNGLGLATKAEDGRLIVTGVQADSAAAAAGLQPDDQILKFNGVPESAADISQLRTIAGAINAPLLHSATITWRSTSGAEKTQKLDW